jgi:transcription elongation factor Elf1
MTVSWSDKIKWAQENYKTQKKPNACPFCGHDEVEGSGVDINKRQAWQPVSCDKCGSGWTDVYERTGFVEPDLTPAGEALVEKRMERKKKVGK